MKTKRTVVDTETRRKKQQALITELLERKIRMHAQHLYDQRGQSEGLALQDWVEAEAEVLGHTGLATLYRKTRPETRSSDESAETDRHFAESDAALSGASA
jgi:hypothetical protein